MVALVVVSCFLRNSKNANPSLSGKNAPNNSNKLSRVDLLYYLQLYSSTTSELVTLNDSLSVYFLDSFRVLQYSLGILEPSGEGKALTARDPRPGEQVVYDYVVYTTGRPEGYLFQIHKDTSVLINVDSILNIKAFSSANFRVEADMRLIDSAVNSEGRVKKTYVTDSPRANYPDTAIFTFDATMNDVQMSLSKNFDSTLYIKLVKVHMIMKPTTEAETLIPKRDFKFELKKKEIADTSFIYELVEKYRKLRTKM